MKKSYEKSLKSYEGPFELEADKILAAVRRSSPLLKSKASLIRF